MEAPPTGHQLIDSYKTMIVTLISAQIIDTLQEVVTHTHTHTLFHRTLSFSLSHTHTFTSHSHILNWEGEGSKWEGWIE